MFYWDDVEVGQKASFGRYKVTREEVLEFATRYDPQPFHLSDEAAAQTFFGRLAASGWHTCAMTMRMIVDDMKDRKTASLGSPGIDELRWLKPVYPGDVLRVETEVIEARPSRSNPAIGSVRSNLTVFNQKDEAVVRFTSIALMGRRPAAQA